MTEYKATQQDMQQYAELLHQLGIIDCQVQQLSDQRNQVLQAISQWEQQHALAEPTEEEVKLED